MTKATIDPEKLAKATERLRKSQDEMFTTLREAGYKVGLDWALQSATAKELARLDRAATDEEIGLDDDAPSENVYYTMHPGDRSRDAADFWREVVNNDVDFDTYDWMSGFIDGALKAWEVVKARIAEENRATQVKP